MDNLFPFNHKIFEFESSRLLLGLNKSFENVIYDWPLICTLLKLVNLKTQKLIYLNYSVITITFIKL